MRTIHFVSLSLFLLSSLASSLPRTFYVACVSVLLVWPSKRQVKRDVTSLYYCVWNKQPRQQLLAISHASKSHLETIELDSGSPGVASSRCKRRGRRNEGESRSTHMSTHLPSTEEPAPTLPEKSIDRWSRCDREAACLDDAKITVGPVKRSLARGDLLAIFQDKVYILWLLVHYSFVFLIITQVV